MSYTRGKLNQKLGEIDKAIKRYLMELDRVDEALAKTGSKVPTSQVVRASRKSLDNGIAGKAGPRYSANYKIDTALAGCCWI